MRLYSFEPPPLLQLRVLRFCLLVDGNVRVSDFPEGKKGLIRSRGIGNLRRVTVAIRVSKYGDTSGPFYQLASTSKLPAGSFFHGAVAQLKANSLSVAWIDQNPARDYVSERFAAQYFPGGNPLGHRIWMGEPKSNEPWLTIVGVAKETAYSLWDPTPHPAVYMDTAQLPPMATEYAISTNGDPLTLAPATRRALASLDPALPLDTVESYAQLLHDNLTGLMYVAAILAYDALFALFLAAVGIFGIMANLVGERTREIGVRLAMGARREDMLGMILRRAAKLTAIGLGSGLLLAFALAHGLATLLRGVRPDDPLVFDGIAATITIVALASSWIPARRAAHVEPMAALRDE